MDSKTTNLHNKLTQLEKSMLMYGIYNAEMIIKLLTWYIISITLLHLMKNYLQGQHSLLNLRQCMQMH